MRIVLDTNVLVSGLINPHGAPGRVVDQMLAGTITVLYDDRLLSEYRDVLARPVFGFLAADVALVVDAVVQSGEAVLATSWNGALPDRTDQPFLEVAISGHADALVTGNARHIRPRRGHHAVTVQTPADLVARLAAW